MILLSGAKVKCLLAILEGIYGGFFIANIYVWIFQNGVKSEAKLFRLPAGDCRQGGLCGA